MASAARSRELPCVSIQALVEKGLKSVPEEYILPQTQRPSPSETLHRIPVIDLADLEASQGRERVIEAIRQACLEWGFFQAVNHGVPSSLMESMLEVARRFFRLPVETKMKYYATDLMSPVRFDTSFNASKDDVLHWRDFLRHYSHPLADYACLWPDEPSDYREIASGYCLEVRSLALRLLSAISESLGLRSDYIETAFGEQSQMVVLNYYPPCPNPSLVLGVGAHSDVHGLTILQQEDEIWGLQVYRSGGWVDVKPMKNAFVVNVGDQIQILSNGRYASVEHRALVNSSCSRISIATGYGPCLDAVIGPAPELCDDGDQKPLYKAIGYREYWKSLLGKGLHGKAQVDSNKNHS